MPVKDWPKYSIDKIFRLGLTVFRKTNKIQSKFIQFYSKIWKCIVYFFHISCQAYKIWPLIPVWIFSCRASFCLVEKDLWQSSHTWVSTMLWTSNMCFLNLLFLSNCKLHKSQLWITIPSWTSLLWRFRYFLWLTRGKIGKGAIHSPRFLLPFYVVKNISINVEW